MRNYHSGALVFRLMIAALPKPVCSDTLNCRDLCYRHIGFQSICRYYLTANSQVLQIGYLVHIYRSVGICAHANTSDLFNATTQKRLIFPILAGREQKENFALMLRGMVALGKISDAFIIWNGHVASKPMAHYRDLDFRDRSRRVDGLSCQSNS
jgi:hypothetical protein